MLFNKLSRHRAGSAGTKVDTLLADNSPSTRMIKHASGKTASEGGPTGAHFVIAYMREEGIDISENIRRQLTPEMVHEADRVVVITAQESWPEYLVKSQKVIFWDIPNAVGMSAEPAREVYDQVKQRVSELVAEIG